MMEEQPWALTIDILNRFSCPMKGSFRSTGWPSEEGLPVAKLARSNLFIMWHDPNITDDQAGRSIWSYDKGGSGTHTLNVITGHPDDLHAGDTEAGEKPVPLTEERSSDLIADKLSSDSTSVLLYRFTFDLPEITLGQAKAIESHFEELTDQYDNPLVVPIVPRAWVIENMLHATGVTKREIGLAYSIPVGSSAHPAIGNIHIVLGGTAPKGAEWHSPVAAQLTIRKDMDKMVARPALDVMMSW